MARPGYNPDKCIELRRQRNNLNAKLYRRRKKLSADPSDKSLIREIDKIKDQKDRLNSRIWKCTKQYYNLSKEKERVRLKIYRRNKKLEQVDKKTKEAAQIRKELSKLRGKKDKIQDRLFSGSPQYRNLRVNYERIGARINYLRKKGRQIYKKMTSKNVSAEDRKRYRNEHLKIVTQLKELGDEQRMLEELITGKKIDTITPDKVGFRLDIENEIEYYPDKTIYNYMEVVDMLLSRKHYEKAVVKEHGTQTAAYKLPSQEISLMATLNEMDLKNVKVLEVILKFKFMLFHD